LPAILLMVLEPAMNRMLIIALVAACLVNLFCLLGHLGSVAG